MNVFRRVRASASSATPRRRDDDERGPRTVASLYVRPYFGSGKKTDTECTGRGLHRSPESGVDTQRLTHTRRPVTGQTTF